MSLVLAGALPALLTFVPSVPLSYGCKASSPLLLSPHKQSIRPPSFGGRSGDVLLQGGGGGSGFGGGSNDEGMYGGDDDDEGWEGTNPGLLVTAITVMIIFGRRGGGGTEKEVSSGKSVFQQIQE